MKTFRFLKEKKWLLLRVIFFSYIILFTRIDGKEISKAADVDLVAFLIIVPITFLFFLIMFKFIAVTTINDPLKPSRFSSNEEWENPSLLLKPFNMNNPPIWIYDIGNFFIIDVISTLIHCRFYDNTVIWYIAIKLGIGLSMHLVLLIIKKRLKWKFKK